MKGNKMKVAEEYRILIAPLEIAGYYRNISEGFQECGVEYDFITFNNHRFKYGGQTRSSVILKLAVHLQLTRKKYVKAKILRFVLGFLEETLRSIWALSVTPRYNVFVFPFARSLLRYNLDLPLLKFLRKTVICNVGHGSEARPSFVNGALQSWDGSWQPTVEYLAKMSMEQSARLARIEKYATFVIGAPYSSTQFLSRPIINWFALGVPFAGERQNAQLFSDGKSMDKGDDKKDFVRILHAPSHPALKGTNSIEAAIEALRKKGYNIEFTLIQDRPYSEVLQEINVCDFVIDQIYSDTPLATFATEAAWFGKPAVVGGYGLEQLRKHVPYSMFPPSKLCHPDEIQQAIESLISDPKECARLGRSAQEFVRKQWHSKKVAERYLMLVSGNIPDEWWLEPESVIYMEGCGLPNEQIKKNIRGLVKEYGKEALQLSHRPRLLGAFIEFAGLGDNK